MIEDILSRLLPAIENPAGRGTEIGMLLAEMDDVLADTLLEGISETDCTRLRDACLKCTDLVVILEVAAMIALYGDGYQEAEVLLEHAASFGQQRYSYYTKRAETIRVYIGERL